MLAPVTMTWTPVLHPDFPSRWLGLCGCTLLLLLSGCISTATQQLATNLSTALVNQNDPALVRDGTPAHLLLLEGLLEGEERIAFRLHHYTRQLLHCPAGAPAHVPSLTETRFGCRGSGP